MHLLITGGAGFIGSRLALKLVGQGASVTILDALIPQVHGLRADFSDSLARTVTCIRGDVCNRELVARLLKDTEVLIHLAAETGTGQSMYAVERYSQINIQGTAVILDAIVNEKPKKLHKLIVASSRAVYGEGEYLCPAHDHVFPAARSFADMERGCFEPKCPLCGQIVTPVPTTEEAPFAPSSFYGLTKQMQEQMVLMFARALGIDGFALRYQNVFGPGQSLTNPYTGILAIFSNLVRQGRGLNIFEDGLESRDFVYIDDVVDATLAVATCDVRGVTALNVGSGTRTSVLDVARAIVRHFNVDVPVEVTGAFRLGDIRHNFADISRLRDIANFRPRWPFSRGLVQFLDWAQQHPTSDAGFERSLLELRERGLMRDPKAGG
jgi:dTDP-L-rhamnose 4-epimerase